MSDPARTRSTHLRIPLLLSTGALVLTACSSGTNAASGSGAEALAAEDIKLAYIVKFGTVPYFVEEAAGIGRRPRSWVSRCRCRTSGRTRTPRSRRRHCDRAGRERHRHRRAGPEDRTVRPDQGQDAGVQVIAIDDPIEAADGTPSAWVGFDSSQVGQQVGETAAKAYDELGWSEFDDVKIASVEQNTLSVCKERTERREEGVPGQDRLRPEQDRRRALRQQPGRRDQQDGPSHLREPRRQALDHLVLQRRGRHRRRPGAGQRGFAKDNILGAGLGGTDTACDEFAKGATSGLKSTIYFDSAAHGAKAVELLVEKLKGGEDMPRAPSSPACR
jgi:hypothetical protein